MAEFVGGSSSPKQDSELKSVISYVLSASWDPKDDIKRSQLLLPPLDDKRDRQSLETIFRGLHFPGMNNREEDIPERFATTVEWVFREPRKSKDAGGGAPMWSDFPKWLEGGGAQDIYWITGKPGSGKSTLTKFIAQDPRFEQTSPSLVWRDRLGNRPVLLLERGYEPSTENTRRAVSHASSPGASQTARADCRRLPGSVASPPIFRSQCETAQPKGQGSGKGFSIATESHRRGRGGGAAAAAVSEACVPY